jgi:hypothetical protein
LAVWVTGAWWLPLGARLSAINQPDATLFVWLLTWTPHALGSGLPPLLTTTLNAPDGVNLMWNNGMALPALLFAPVTAAWGGLATVTVLTAVGLAGSATAAFGALRALGAATGPAALGGAAFGFSPAIVAQSLGHPNLVLNVLVPVLVLLAVRLAVEERPRFRTAATSSGPPSTAPYVGGQPTPTGILLRAVQLDGQVRPPTPLVRSTFAHDVQRWRACAAVLGPSPHADAVRAQITALAGREPESVAGVLLWRNLAR